MTRARANLAGEMPVVKCVVCHSERQTANTSQGIARTPRGWKTLRGQPYCPSCKRSSYSLRALILPVAKPEGASWAEFRERLRPLWIETTRCANWMVSELYARDVRRGPEDSKLPPMPHTYLYPEARVLFPTLSAQAVAALSQEVLRCYRARRSGLLWFRSESLPTYTYPVGLTIPTQAWSLLQRDGRWAVSVRLGHARLVLILRGGQAMHRQLRRLAQVASGDAVRGSLTLFEAAVTGPTHRHAATGAGTRVMVKIAAWLPNAAARGTRVVRARTAADALLAGAGRWRIDPEPMRGVLAAEERRRTAIQNNLRIARAHSTQRPLGIESALSDLSRKSRRRIADACRTYAAHFVDHARAERARAVHYDDSVRPPLPHFPWEQLRRRIAEKLQEHGIDFVHVNRRAAVDAALVPARKGGDEHAA